MLHYTSPFNNQLRIYLGPRNVADLIRLETGWYLVTDFTHRRFPSLSAAWDVMKTVESRYLAVTHP